MDRRIHQQEDGQGSDRLRRTQTEPTKTFLSRARGRHAVSDPRDGSKTSMDGRARDSVVSQDVLIVSVRCRETILTRCMVVSIMDGVEERYEIYCSWLQG